MIILVAALQLAASSPPLSQADSLRVLAMRLPDSALVVEARAHPLVLRDAVVDAMTRAVKGRPSEKKENLDAAHRLALAYATAWRDFFLLREVERFSASSASRRTTKVWVDSVRRVGIVAFGRQGPSAAIRMWRRALSRAKAIDDTARVAALLGNIGAGLWRQSQFDSAVTYLEQSRLLAAAVGDLRAQANAIGTLANVYAERGDLSAAREHHTQALTLRERLGDGRGVAADLNNLGLLAQAVGDTAEARRQFEAALSMNRRDGREEVAATNLVNLAGLASLTGDFARAEGLYRNALTAWRDHQMWADAADALLGLGQLGLRRGDYPAAIAAFMEALRLYENTELLMEAARTRRDLAGALAAAGELQRALGELRRARRDADSVGAPLQLRGSIALAQADLALQLNSRAEADRLYAQAEALYRGAGDSWGEAEAQQGRAVLLMARDDYVRAQSLFERALRTQIAKQNHRAAALTRLWLGSVARARGDTASARRQIVRAARELTRLGDPVAAGAALGELASLEAAAGLPARAESLYRAALQRLEDRVAPEVAWRLHAGLALVRRAQGAADDAMQAFRAALTEIERPRRTLALPERRSGFLADKWDVYAQVVLAEHGRGRIGPAFEASERLRAREMLELLARGRIATAETATPLVAREQDLRRRIGELAGQADRAVMGSEAVRGPDVSRTTAATREALLSAQAAYTELLLEMREQAPRHAGLVSVMPASWRDVARQLSPSEALVEYLVSDSGSLAFVVRHDTIAAVELGVARHELVRLVEFARGTMQPNTQTGRLWHGPLQRLHRHLIAPLEEAGLLAGRTRLVLVPHAELHYLPFAALLEANGAGRFLGERYELTVTPSASVWLALRERRSTQRGTGVLALAPKTQMLSASRREVSSIARLTGPNTRVITDAEATEEAFRRDAPTRRVIHLATFGVLNKHNPLFSFVELAPNGEHDGRLEVHEVFGLRLAADLVVLSACQTGLGSGAIADVPPGDDWVGLTRAFLHAGAARVVASLWPVQDVATATLMERFYERLASGADPVQALAAAQRALRSSPSTAHPFYWAGFVIVGGAVSRDEQVREGRPSQEADTHPASHGT